MEEVTETYTPPENKADSACCCVPVLGTLAQVQAGESVLEGGSAVLHFETPIPGRGVPGSRPHQARLTTGRKVLMTPQSNKAEALTGFGGWPMGLLGLGEGCALSHSKWE